MPRRRSLGYKGGYDAIRRYARSWSKDRGVVMAEAYVPLYYAPGETYQFDWSHEVVLIAGITATVKVPHVRLCHSRMMFARAYMREVSHSPPLMEWMAPAPGIAMCHIGCCHTNR